jgi:tetratricopeptide (TPR) repeat protein
MMTYYAKSGRRAFLVVAALVFGSLAGAEGQRSPAAELESWKTASLNQYGRDLLKRGRNFERAIEALEMACGREPDNADFQLALGCAFASRLASVSFALRRAESYQYEARSYERLKTEWDNAQQDRNSPEFGKPAPPVPARPTTPDDDRPFGLNKDATAPILLQLGRSSVAAFDEARRLASTATSEKRCEVEFTRGWGLYLIRRFGKGVDEDRPKGTDKPGVVTQPAGAHLYLDKEDISDCFRRCTHEDPKNSDYWQSLGLSLVPKITDAAGEGAYSLFAQGAAMHKSSDMEEAVRAFRRALALKPGDFDLLYQAAHVSAGSNMEEAIGYLERAIQRVGTNAVPWYLLAELRYLRADRDTDEAVTLREKALSAVEAGSRAPRYAAVPLTIPVPAMLKPAWEYSRLYGLGEDAFTATMVGHQIQDVVKQQSGSGEVAAAVKSIEALMAMGWKILEHCDGSDVDRQDPRMRTLLKSRLTMEVVTCHRAYGMLKDLQQAHPSPAVTRLVAEYRAMIPKLMEIDRDAQRNP